ncbi:MAG: UDP-N-acetylmuramate--L-alanine ligase [Oscillospiraceae bacterium]|nr:UDP-N-acetylmuramate--L-alanine ligase [Oscillospiraceae bacterium]
MKQNDSHLIHYIGIGGSGMYPLAQILHGKGFNLSGSDNNQTDTVDAVRKMGISVFMGHSPENVVNASAIVRSAAISDDNPEIIKARELRIPVIERSELLGYITKQYNKAVCVSGTHGKTTVSSMLAYIFMNGDCFEQTDISAVIGGKLKILDGGSGRSGGSDIMICEACEYADTFLQLAPNVSVIINIDEDHLEYFGSMDNLRLSFTKFCNITTDYLVVNGDDANTMLAVKNSEFSGKVVTFGKSASNDFYPLELNGNAKGGGNVFELVHNGQSLTTIRLNVPGEHNALNAVCACAVATTLGCSPDTLSKGLEAFTGARRRFEILGEVNGITVADDYAHHPAEITVTLKAAKSMGYERVWAVHQPFTYSRTKSMLGEFAKALSIADEITLTEIMGSREVDPGDIHSADLVREISKCGKNCDYFSTFDDVANEIVENCRTHDLIITLGCGDVNKIAHNIIHKINAKFML